MANILIVSSNLKNWDKNSGGVERTATLAEALVGHNVTFLCFAWDQSSEVKKITNNIKFVKPAIENAVIQKHRLRIGSDAKANHDITKYIYKKYLKSFNKQVQLLSSQSDLVILDHFSAAPFIEDIIGTVPIIYNSHNAEITMANQLHPDDSFVNDIVEKMERLAVTQSVAMTYCSEKDFKEIKKYYNTVPEDNIYIPNGTVIRDRINPKKRLNSKDIIFVGSGHPPNVIAANKIIDIAKAMPKYNFIIVGGASNGLDKKKMPENMTALGVVNDNMLNSLLTNSLAFINPMDSGSGTHLKMMKALSYGIPIISSQIGARGFSEEEVSGSMIIAETTADYVEAIKSLSDVKMYDELSTNGFNVAKSYDWETIKKNYLSFVNSMLDKNVTAKKQLNESKKEKVLLYSIVRNIEPKFDQYYHQIKKIVKAFPEYEFYLSIYENDSTDRTKARLHTTDWSFLNGVSVVTENIQTDFYGSVKDPVRVENLSRARNKAIEAGGFLDNVDYILMVEGDLAFSTTSVKELLNFKDIKPNFDVVSAVSIRKNGTHYDWWATRTGPVYKPEASELDPEYSRKHYGEYYATSNGLVLYRAKPFKEGVRHGWINTVTKEFDCEMVVLCQNLRAKGYNNIYINYKSQTFV
jgi:glycosyltransferase involved in cell wall biosynthesis